MAVKEERRFTSEELIERFSSVSYWGLNQPTNKIIEEFSREFLRARVGINLLFYFVSETKSLADENLSSIDELSKLSEVLSKLGSNFDFKKYEQQLGEIIESNHKSFSCKSGIPKNILEFVGHVLRRRETAENGMKSYDQGYFVKRKGGKNSVWISGLALLLQWRLFTVVLLIDLVLVILQIYGTIFLNMGLQFLFQI